MSINNNNIEFKALGLKIENLSITYGLFLIFWGIFVSFLSNSQSFTSYIPSILGLPILIFSYLSIVFVNKKKLFMHIVVIFGLIIFLGGLDFLRSLFSGSLFENLWADITKLIMLITSILFLYYCIKSFIHARKNKSTET
tara:strand:+ start:2884 stop:3303 length:420 start_codon:yes stop_codon:yes gene_type:complete